MSTQTAPASELPTPWRDKLNGVLFVALMTVAVIQLSDLPFIRELGLSPLIVGIVCGMLYGNFLRGTMPADWAVGVNFTARRLLRIAVAFYGLNISIQQIIAIGMPGLAVSVVIVVGTLVIGTTVGQRLLGLDRDTAMLTSAGSAICGAAAVLAFEPTLRAAPHKSAVAVATVVLFGTLSMFLYPIAYHAGWLPLTPYELGLFIGGTVHEVAQVVGAASNIDPATTEVATIVKMTRVALLVPVILILGMWLRRAATQEGDGTTQGKTRLPIPWFAIGFLVFAIINSINILPLEVVTALRRLDIFALTMAMTALGMETRFSHIRRAGPKVLLLGFILYIWLVFGGYALVKAVA